MSPDYRAQFESKVIQKYKPNTSIEQIEVRASFDQNIKLQTVSKIPQPQFLFAVAEKSTKDEQIKQNMVKSELDEIKEKTSRVIQIFKNKISTL